MAITFTTLLTDCLVALGDSSGTTWSRVNRIWPWCVEAIQAFPILRPMSDDHTNGVSTVYSIIMPSDFRYVISVEYPLGDTHLARKNRLDPNFNDKAGYYDIDHDYTTGSGWKLYISGGVPPLAHVKTQYLANHDTAMADDSVTEITVPDEYEHILIAYVISRAFRERLSKYMQDPTAHSSIIQQMTEMVDKAENHYELLVQQAHEKLADSKISPSLSSDQYDRVY